MKTNTKFTAGPWACEKTGDGKRWIIGENQSTWGTHVGEVHRDDIDRDEAEANAGLIQRAPEMHALLKKCFAHLNESRDTQALALSLEVANLLDATAAPTDLPANPRVEITTIY